MSGFVPPPGVDPDAPGTCRECSGSGLMLVPDTDGESASLQACAYCPAGDDPPALKENS